MSSGTMMQYTDDEIIHIMHEGFSYTLEKSVIDNIQKIANEVGAPEYIRTPQFLKQNPNYISDKKKKFKKHQSSEILDEDWETFRNFQTTEIQKKEGIDKSLDIIRKHINKMSEKTYRTLTDKIFDEINDILGEGNPSPELLVELNKVGDAIFNIASSNMFYSALYADLYNELMTKYSFMKTIFRQNYDEFITLFNNFETCDPNEDYDKFCQINKNNEKRRAVSLFYVNLMKKDVVSVSSISKILLELQNNIIKLIDEEDKKAIIEELSEVVFLLVSNGKDELKMDNEWKNIFDNITTVSKIKTKTRPSISNKTIFKHMDLIDEIEKN
jgi:hypothetical protein